MHSCMHMHVCVCVCVCVSDHPEVAPMAASSIGEWGTAAEQVDFLQGYFFVHKVDVWGHRPPIQYRDCVVSMRA